MSGENAIEIRGLKKQYRLGQIGGGTLTADLQSWWARVRHQEDPNSKIGTDQRRIGQAFMALNGIDLTVKKGEALGIIGSNGAGKSTLLKILSRITAPTEGTVDIYGRITSMLEVGTGFSPEMTGRENIYMNGAILGMSRAEIDEKMEEIIEFSEVREFIDTPVKRYSSGMYVKLAFSVAAHLDSEIMIMDEVLAVGDVNFQQKCLKKMREAATIEGKTVLYVSHNMNTIRQLCNRCIVLNSGKLVFCGETEKAIEIYENNSVLEKRSEYDLTRLSRITGLTNVARMERLRIACSDVGMNQQLKFELQCMCDSPIQNTMLRFVLFDKRGNTLGATYSNMWDLVSGHSAREFALDCSVLAPGEYYADIILISYDGGIQIRHDIAIKAFAFSVREDNILYNMEWNRHGWGCIRLPSLRTEG
ncbi:MAG: ATP-binding cassette domain-containing protein [Oscillospiraceae bacterium]|nr:ATP-binding cassette domain-containing protein [Oscillospiraceae bacterium]